MDSLNRYNSEDVAYANNNFISELPPEDLFAILNFTSEENRMFLCQTSKSLHEFTIAFENTSFNSAHKLIAFCTEFFGEKDLEDQTASAQVIDASATEQTNIPAAIHRIDEILEQLSIIINTVSEEDRAKLLISLSESNNKLAGRLIEYSLSDLSATSLEAIEKNIALGKKGFTSKAMGAVEDFIEIANMCPRNEKGLLKPILPNFMLEGALDQNVLFLIRQRANVEDLIIAMAKIGNIQLSRKLASLTETIIFYPETMFEFAIKACKENCYDLAIEVLSSPICLQYRSTLFNKHNLSFFREACLAKKHHEILYLLNKLDCSGPIKKEDINSFILPLIKNFAHEGDFVSCQLIYDNFTVPAMQPIVLSIINQGKKQQLQSN